MLSIIALLRAVSVGGMGKLAMTEQARSDGSRYLMIHASGDRTWRGK